MNLQNKSEKRVIVSFSIVMLLIVALGIVSILKISDVADQTRKFNKHPLTVLTSTYKIQRHLISIHRYMKDIVLSENEEEFNEAFNKIEDDEKTILKEFDTIFSNYLGDQKDIQATRDLVIQWRNIREDVFYLIKNNRQKEAIKLNRTVAYNHLNNVIDSSDVLSRYAHNKAKSFVEISDRTENFSVSIIIVIVSVILMIIFIIMITLLKSLAKIEIAKIDQDKKSFQQSRLAQMGEMISMIAHQWRQPLSSISATATSMLIKLELGTSNIEDTKEQLTNISNYTQHLSETIEDFRNFYKPNKLAVERSAEELVSKSLGVIRTSLIDNNIKIIEKYDSAEKIKLYDSEIIQVILNILKNAQDNFIDKNTKDAEVEITIKGKTIMICDNGGGIKEEIINNIFDPYFSTKDDKNGTGLGLYMSKIIVEDHHAGKIYATNIDKGVCFTIELNDAVVLEN